MDIYPYMPDGPGSSGLSVLYVDDEPAVLKLSKRFLEKDAHLSVVAAASAREAIDLLTTRHVDAIVSDYSMPEMDGIEFLKYTREHCNDIPFIIVTGKGEEDVVIQALNLGADFYLQKGGDPDAHYSTLIHNIKRAVAHQRSVQALHESEERYRNVVEDQTELISRFLPDGTHVFVNEAYCRYYGMNREEIIGHRFAPEIPPPDRKRINDMLTSLTPHNPVMTIEHPIIKPDGTTRWQQWSDRAIFDEHGRVIEYQSVGRDITDRKLAEEEVRSAAVWWQRTFDGITDPIFIFERDGTILRSNAAASAILGIPHDRIIGRKCHELVHGTPDFIPGCPFTAMLGSSASESYTLQWNGRWFKVTTHPVFDENGMIAQAIHVMTDIDLITRAAEERARLAAIIDSSQDAIISITLDGSIASWNESAERMFDHPANEIIGKHYEEILTEGSAPVWREAFTTLLKGESVRHGETALLARGGRTFEASFSLSPVRDYMGELSGIAAIIRDLSDQRKAERDLIAFVTEAALRLKNPVEIMREDLTDLLRMVSADSLSGQEISLLLHVQIRNAGQILENLQALNKAIVEGHDEIPRAYREFLSG